MVDADSRPLGAVRLRALLIENDPPSPTDLHRLNQYIDEKLASFIKRHRDERFDRVVATSSTPAALVCAANRIPRAERDSADRMGATTAQIRRLFNELSQESLENRRRWIGIGPRRAEIIIGGAAVFLKVLEIFGQPRCTIQPRVFGTGSLLTFQRVVWGATGPSFPANSAMLLKP